MRRINVYVYVFMFMSRLVITKPGIGKWSRHGKTCSSIRFSNFMQLYAVRSSRRVAKHEVNMIVILDLKNSLESICSVVLSVKKEDRLKKQVLRG